MKQWILFLLLLLTPLLAEVKVLNYKATFGMFGTVGLIENRLTFKGNHYTIDTTVTLKGLAKMMLGGQKEHYISMGHLEKGVMVSDHYIMTTQKKHKKIEKEYIIDHKRHRVTKIYTKWVDEKRVKHTKKVLDFYAKDDLLTLYFNMDRVIRAKGVTYHLKAVGLEKQKGLVDVVVPSPKEEKAYRKDLGESANWYAKALIVQKNFKKKKGDILLSVADDGYIQKAVIKDILFYGDAQLIRTK
jgi:hypothetical protein